MGGFCKQVGPIPVRRAVIDLNVAAVYKTPYILKSSIYALRAFSLNNDIE